MEQIMVNAHDWNEPFNPGLQFPIHDDVHGAIFPQLVVWNAHRPLHGQHTWEGAGRWGVHYAATLTDAPNFNTHTMLNHRDDAREVKLVTNRKLLPIAAQMLAESGYSFTDYIEACDGDRAQAVREVMARYQLPWARGDRSADALVDQL